MTDTDGGGGEGRWDYAPLYEKVELTAPDGTVVAAMDQVWAQAIVADRNELLTLRADLDRALAERELELGHAHEDWLHVKQDEVETLRAYKGLLREFMEHRPQSSAELADWLSRVADALTETGKEGKSVNRPDP